MIFTQRPRPQRAWDATGSTGLMYTVTPVGEKSFALSVVTPTFQVIVRATSHSAASLRNLAHCYDADPHNDTAEIPRLARAIQLMQAIDPYQKYENTWETTK